MGDSPMTKSFKQFLEEARDTKEYQIESIKLGFAVQIEKILRATDESRAQLAAKLGKSRSYVTKVMHGDTNFTLNTMLVLAKAVGGKLKIDIEHPAISEKTKTKVVYVEIPSFQTTSLRSGPSELVVGEGGDLLPPSGTMQFTDVKQQTVH
jgi:transcriptional regulator with XRE-family HTH domain